MPFLLLSVAALLAARAAAAKQCAAFDISGNLYLFGGTNDVSLGASSAWASPSPTTLPTSGRPPWTGNSTQCFTSYYVNALYVIQADESNPSDIYIYDFAGSAWSKQSTSGAPTLDGASSLVDHDTNVLYTLTSTGELWDLDMGNIKATASGSALAWNDVGKAGISTTGYRPVMAEASQHIIFFGVPSVAAGSAPLYVIHYNYFQPDTQTFPATSGSTSFPDTHGQVAGIPFAPVTNAGDQILFIPDDFSNAFVISHWTSPSTAGSASGAPSNIANLINTTQVLAAPTSHDVNAVYAATDSSFVQLDSAGDIYYIANAISSFAVSSSASWTKMSYTLAGLTGSGGSNSSSSSGSGSGTKTTSSSSGSPSSGSGSSSGGSGSSSGSGSGAAAGVRVGAGLAAVVLGAAAMML